MNDSSLTSSFWFLFKIQTIYSISEKLKLLYLRFEWVQPSFRIRIFKIQKTASWTTRKVTFALLISRYNYKLNKICVWLLLFLLSQSTVTSKCFLLCLGEGLSWSMFIQSCFFSILFCFCRTRYQKSQNGQNLIRWLFFGLANGLINSSAYNTFNCNEGVYVNLQQSNINFTKWIERPEMDLNPSNSCHRQWHDIYINSWLLVNAIPRVDTACKTLLPSSKLEQMLAIK